MAVLILHTLNEKQREDILKLIAACNEYDGLKRLPQLQEDDNYNEELNSYYCYYEENDLLSVLLLYQPFSEEAEISAYTLPSYRRQGYFKVLLDKAWEELKKFGVHHAAFVVEYQSKDGKACAISFGSRLKRSDYLMAYDYKQEKKKEVLQTSEHFIVTDLTSQNFKDGITVFRKIFNWEEEQIEEIMHESLVSEVNHTYLAYINGKIAGTLSIYRKGKLASVFGFGIIKKYRGKGYGKYFLTLILSSLEKEGKDRVMLQVESESHEAFNLYLKTGFSIVEEYDYYYKNI